MRYSVFETAWGVFGFVEHDRRLVSTFFPRARRETVRTICSTWPDAIEARDVLPRFQQAVVDYFEGKHIRFEIEIDVSRMPPFHQSVLAACRGIPYGQTASYADLARAAGKPNAARAVGGAMARNPLPLVVPCHRVLRADGSIGGFSSTRGLEEKHRLLRLEKVATDWHGDGPVVGAANGRAFTRFRGVSGMRRPALAV